MLNVPVAVSRLLDVSEALWDSEGVGNALVVPERVKVTESVQDNVVDTVPVELDDLEAVVDAVKDADSVPPIVAESDPVGAACGQPSFVCLVLHKKTKSIWPKNQVKNHFWSYVFLRTKHTRTLCHI